MNELSDIEAELIKHPSALELGCGAARLCRRLQELGLQATGVDESPVMLALLPPGIEGIEARIETMNIGRRWPTVLLPSHLINHPDESARRSFVDSAKRHVEQGLTSAALPALRTPCTESMFLAGSTPTNTMARQPLSE